MSNWYRAGTVSMVNGQSIVNGVATYWLTAPARPVAGDIFTVNNQTLYEIASIALDGRLTLDRPFVGATASGVSYAIIRNASATTNTRLAAQVSDTLNKLGNKITVSTTAPSSGQGVDGDIWIVVQDL